MQSLLRHANSNITMNIYTHAVSSKKRRAQSLVVEMILREEKTTPGAAGCHLMCIFLCIAPIFQKWTTLLE